MFLFQVIPLGKAGVNGLDVPLAADQAEQEEVEHDLALTTVVLEIEAKLKQQPAQQV